MDVVKSILEKPSFQAKSYKSTSVDKLIDLDVGALLAVDSNELDLKALSKDPDDFLLRLTRDNVQLLFNELWELPTEQVDEVIVAKLPKQRFYLPRYKPVPRPRQPTKWELFAKEKGIVKKKKDKLTWDDQLKKWIPLYGFKRAAAQKDKEWLVEVPQNADPMEDQFAKRSQAKSENVAKNELQRLRNIAKAHKVKVPRFGLGNPEVSSAKELQAAVTVAKSSTASLGKFQDKLPKEKEARRTGPLTPGASRKRKMAPVSGVEEKRQNLDIVESVLNKRPKIDLEKAVDREVNKQKNPPSESKKSRKRGGGGGGGKPASGSTPRKPSDGAHSGGNKKKPKNNPNRPRKGKTAGGRKRR